MAAFTLRLGNLDLSNYTRVAQGDGLDPLDSSGFLDPQFSDSVVAEGAPLVYVTQGNREMAFPLYLKSATKDALADLLQSVNWEIENTKPLTIEWKDQGATASTFYDVTFARFDPDYNYRRAGQNWLGGILRVWASPPYGHTGTMRILATGVASGSALRVAIPSSIEGDVDAQLKVQIRHAGANSWEGDQVGVAVLPNTNWQPIIGASSFYSPLTSSNSLFQGTIGVASLAPGGVAYNVKIDRTYFGQANANGFYNYKTIQDSTFGFALGASQYSGNIRVLAAVRSSSRRGIGMQLLDGAGDPVANMVTATGWRGFSLVDLGRISMPTDIDGATKTWSVRLSTAQLLEVQRPPSVIDQRITDDPYSAQVAQLYVLPEDKMQLFNDSPREANTALNIYGNGVAFSLGNDTRTSITDLYGRTWTATNAIVRQDTFAQYVLGMSIATGFTNFALYTNTEDFNDYAFEAEYDGYLFTGVASAYSVVQARRNLQLQFAGCTLGVNASGQTYISAYGEYGVTFLGLASKGFAPPASPSGTLILRGRKQGPVINLAAEWYAYANGTGGLASSTVLATVAASSALIQTTSGGWYINNWTATTSINGPDMSLYSFRSHSLPSFSSIATGVYEIDSSRRSAQYKTTTGSYQRDLLGQRGGYQGLPAPSPAAVFVLHQAIDGASDLTSAIVSARERFTYVR